MISVDGQTPIHPADLDGLRPRWIRTQGQLNELEADNLARGARWAGRRAVPLSTALDEAFLRELHERCFGDVWSWAGTYRTRATSIGIDAPGIAVAVRDLLADAALWFGAVDRAEVELRVDLGRLHHRLVSIHPFPNGNGRSARVHADVTAAALGIRTPTWGRTVDEPRAQYLDALRVADGGELDPLIELLWR